LTKMDRTTVVVVVAVVVVAFEKQIETMPID
jgi:hypothetical protein